MDLTTSTSLDKLKAPEGIDYSLEGLKQRFPDFYPTDKEMYEGYLKSFQLANIRHSKDKIASNKARIIQETKAMWTYEECHQYFLWASEQIAKASNYRNGAFVVDQYNREVIHLLCLYFSNDPKFEEYDYNGIKYSLKKGIFLQSDTRGTGKTDLLRAFSLNKKGSFGYQHTAKMRDDFAYKGFSFLESVVTTFEVAPVAQNFYQEKMGVMFDEMFDESIGMFMGNVQNISSYIINRLYDYQKGQDHFWRFHMTSNYDGPAIEAKCGSSIRSRIPEMFNLIKLTGPDRRRG